MERKVSAYQKSDVLGKSPLDLIIQVYDGAIGEFKTSLEAYQNNKNNDGYTHMEKAKRFLTYLYVSLDMEKGGEIATNLSKLYAFMINQINIIEGTKDLKRINDNIDILQNLKSGWLSLKNQQKDKKENLETNNNKKLAATV